MDFEKQHTSNCQKDHTINCVNNLFFITCGGERIFEQEFDNGLGELENIFEWAKEVIAKHNSKFITDDTNCDSWVEVDFGKGPVEIRCTRKGNHPQHDCMVVWPVGAEGFTIPEFRE